MTKKGLTEHEQRMASAWLDQELPEGERDFIESRLVEGDADLREEIEGYRRVRAEFRGWYQQEVETHSRKVDLWSAIEKDIKHSERKRAAAFDWRKSAENFLEQLRRPFSLGGLAAAAALMLFVFTREPQPAMPGQPAARQLAEREAIAIENLQNGVPGAPSLLAGNRVESDLMTRVSETSGPFPGSGRPLGRIPESLAVRLMSSPQLITDPQNRIAQSRDGGFRSGNTDIEWIKTNKPFKLVASRQRQTPPVIWVARTNK